MSPVEALGSAVGKRAKTARLGLLRRALAGPRASSWKPSGAALVAVAVALGASCRSAGPVSKPQATTSGPTATRSPTAGSPPAASGVPWEVSFPPGAIRVGLLTSAKRATLGADSSLEVWGATAPGSWGQPFRLPRVTAVPTASSSAPGFRVQVASLMDEGAAQKLSRQVAESTGRDPVIQWNDTTKTHQVRVGPFATREEATSFVATLSRDGFGGSFVVPDGPGAGAPGRLRLIETGDEYVAIRLRASADDDFVSLGPDPYRGVFELRPNPEGTLTVIDVLDLEEYLRGVVPNELSPSVFPALEALKAQAVAARTYALRNLGQFEASGYDICATPSCQVYRGKGSEHPLTDQAIAETRGLVARSGDRLINALYTSTCGGRTEDGENIFPGEPSAYLRSVACLPESEAWNVLPTTAPTRPLGSGEELNRDASLLVALGVFGSSRLSPGQLDGPATDDDIRTWTSRLLAASRRKACQSEARAPLSRRQNAFVHVLSSLCWTDRANRLLAPKDSEYLLQVEDASGFDGEGARRAAAALVSFGLLEPASDNRLKPDATVTRQEATSLLARAAIEAGAPNLVSAVFKGYANGRLRLLVQDEARDYALLPEARLFRRFENRSLPTSGLMLAVGDKVRVVVDSGKVGFVEADQSRLGAAADRTSRVYRWEVRMTPGEVEKAVSRYGAPGAVRDLRLNRLGSSGRVLELEVVGSSSTLTLKGLQVRWGLGLRENLFVVDREWGEDGQIARFVFTGKGWGHGVGLCQVGAYGLAQSGLAFDQILKHYYTGVRVEPYR